MQMNNSRTCVSRNGIGETEYDTEGQNEKRIGLDSTGKTLARGHQFPYTWYLLDCPRHSQMTRRCRDYNYPAASFSLFPLHIRVRVLALNLLY